MTRKKKNTIYLIIGILVLAIVILVVQRTFLNKPAAYSVITIDGKETERLDLGKDTELKIESPYGGYNVVEISDSAVRVKESDCDNQICVHQGWIRDSFGIIVCLPHRLAVTIEDNE